MFTPFENDSRSIRSAELKNKWKWEESRGVEYEIFQDFLRTCGTDHASTLTLGYNLAEVELESGNLDKSAEWCRWVSENTQRVHGPRHALAMRTESLAAEVLLQKGKYEEAESICANVLARQQMYIGEDHLDTLETRHRIGMAQNFLNHRENAIMTVEKLIESLKRLLGENHIRVFAAGLDMLWYVISDNGREAEALITMQFQGDVQKALEMLPVVYQELQSALGQAHPLTVRALTLYARGLMREQKYMEASEKLRQALAISEETLGPEHPLTINIVGNIGYMYSQQGGQYYQARRPASEALPWLVRYLNWIERHRGADNPETLGTLELVGNIHVAASEWEPAQKYFERAQASLRGTAHAAAAQRVNNQLQICRTYTMLMNRSGQGTRSGVESFLASLQKFK